jgi:tRNA-uridine 2-sulfurtransferase
MISGSIKFCKPGKNPFRESNFFSRLTKAEGYNKVLYIITREVNMKALALLSGGLDSTVAIKIVREAGIEVEAINFTSPFCRCSGAEGGCGAAAIAAKQLDVKLHYQKCGEEYLRIVEKPPHGYGKRMNPCLDCRIHKFMLAHEKMVEIGASFLVTGEVIDQRPNSQRKDALDIVERDSGLRGLILRPLSAKHLRPTIPEINGWIDRSKLLDIKGRGRRQQMDLAESYGIKDYPCPGGGCLLTYEEYSLKVKDLIEFDGSLSLKTVHLLRFGRHMRLSPKVKIIIGKDETENAQLKRLATEQDFVLELTDYEGPITLVIGEANGELLNLAAAITAGFSRAPGEVDVKVLAMRGDEREELWVKALAREESKGFYVYGV